MPLEKGHTQKVIADNIAELMRTGKYSKEQAAAIAYHNAEDGVPAAGVIYLADGNVLLMRRSLKSMVGPGTWGLPAGKIEDGESPEQCARREFLEETGYDLSAMTLNLLDISGNFSLYITKGDVFSPQLNDEHTGFLWATPDDMPKPLFPGMEQQMMTHAVDYAESARVPDFNGWYEVKRNPISRVGVFQYLGKNIPLPGFLPDKMYNVYRPAEELSDPEAIDSFRLLPWIDDHAIMGVRDSGYMGAEEKGIHGVIGQDVLFEDDTLYGNIKLFSNRMGELIESGKRELSVGYRCRYENSSGVWKGKPYDVIQRTLRGNHLALVASGRMGPEVAVLDEAERMSFTFDARDAMADEKKENSEGSEKKEMTLSEASQHIATIVPMMAKMQEQLASLQGAGGADEDASIAATDADDKDKKDDKKDADAKDAKEADCKDADEKEKKEGKADAMDASDIRKVNATLQKLTAALDASETARKSDAAQLEALKKDGLKTMLGEISARNSLAMRISPFVGVFDHQEMTLGDVAKYGNEKLGLKAPAGMERAVLEGFLHGRQNTAGEMGFALDAAATGANDELDKYLSGETKH